MGKTFSILVIAIAFSFVACNKSKDDKKPSTAAKVELKDEKAPPAPKDEDGQPPKKDESAATGSSDATKPVEMPGTPDEKKPASGEGTGKPSEAKPAEGAPETGDKKVVGHSKLPEGVSAKLDGDKWMIDLKSRQGMMAFYLDVNQTPAQVYVMCLETKEQSQAYLKQEKAGGVSLIKGSKLIIRNDRNIRSGDYYMEGDYSVISCQ